MTDKHKRYRVLIGLNYGPGGAIRREPGDIADDIPERSVHWLLANDPPAIEPIEDSPASVKGKGG